MNSELLKQAKAAKTPEELGALAKANNFPMNNPVKAFELLKSHGELSEDELYNVSGGCGFGDIDPDIDYPPMFR